MSEQLAELRKSGSSGGLKDLWESPQVFMGQTYGQTNGGNIIAGDYFTVSQSSGYYYFTKIRSDGVVKILNRRRDNAYRYEELTTNGQQSSQMYDGQIIAYVVV